MDLEGEKGQSAIEYIVTYGWMVIVLVSIVAVLFYLNVFNPANWMGSNNEITGTTTFSFLDFTIAPSGAVTLYMKSESPYRVNVTGIEIGGTNLTGLSPSPPFLMSPGQSRNVTGTSLLSGATGDSFYNVKISLYYTVDGGGEHTDSGIMSGKYS